MKDKISNADRWIIDFERDLNKFRPDLNVSRDFSPDKTKVFLYVTDYIRNRDYLELGLDMGNSAIYWDTNDWKYELSLDETLPIGWGSEQFTVLRDRFLQGFEREEAVDYEYGVCEDLGERTAWVDDRGQAELVLGALTDVVAGDWKLVRRRAPGEPEFVPLP